MEKSYRTLARLERFEIDKIKASRFIASGLPFAGEERLAAEIARLRAEFVKANHHCFAWRDRDRFRTSDDGEPSGSAGKPILQRIDAAGLDRVAVVVTRIFGGTKLGVGGLMRAYADAARQLLARAQIVEVVPYRRVTVTIPYEAGGALASVVNAFGVRAIDSTFDERVRHTFHVECARVAAFVQAVTDQTAARARIAVADEDGP